MIPRTFLSTFASNGQQQMRVYFLSSVAGLKRWADYIPVKLVQSGKENSYDNNGFIDVEVVGRSSTDTPFKEYVPVYVDASASDAWQVNATGYIPYGYAGTGDASLVLDFTNSASLDSRITFTRSTTATYFNSAGVLSSAAINAPRFDYNPATLAPLGLLIEESRTNLLTRSIPDAAVPTGWTVGVGTGTYTHTLVAATGSLSGFQNVIRHAQTTSGRSYLTTTVTLAVSTTYTLTVRFNPGTLSITSGNAAVVFIQGLTGATGTLSLNASSVPSNGVASITFTTATAVSAGIRVGLGCANDATGVAEFAGWQLEAGAFATSYIPTVASQVTRSNDVAVMTGTNFSSWYNTSGGTLLADFAWEGLRSVGGQRVFVLDDGTTSSYWGMVASSVNSMQNPVVVAGTTEASNSTPSATYTANTPYKVALALALNNSVSAISGSAGTTDTTVSIPSGLTTARFAASSSAVVSNIWFRRIAYYPRRLSNAELQGITA